MAVSKAERKARRMAEVDEQLRPYLKRDERLLYEGASGYAILPETQLRPIVAAWIEGHDGRKPRRYCILKPNVLLLA